jgi:hypothetical protein
LVQFQFQFCLLTEQFFPKMFCVPFWFYSYSATIYVADIRSRRCLQRINQSYPENILFRKWKRNYADLNIDTSSVSIITYQ